MTPIVAFVIMIQRIFPSWALAPTQCTIVDSFIFIIYAKLNSASTSMCLELIILKYYYTGFRLSLNEDYLLLRKDNFPVR